MAANALPPYTAIQALAALTMLVSSDVRDREHRINAF
jgi:hypothetical protein